MQCIVWHKKETLYNQYNSSQSSQIVGDNSTLRPDHSTEKYGHKIPYYDKLYLITALQFTTKAHSQPVKAQSLLEVG